MAALLFANEHDCFCTTGLLQAGVSGPNETVDVGLTLSRQKAALVSMKEQPMGQHSTTGV